MKMHLGRVLAVALAISLPAALLAGCTTAALPTTAGIGCSWPYKTDRDTLNVAYPDSGATYWTTSYNLLAGEKLRVSGSFPEARYISLATYSVSGSVVDSVTDEDLPVISGQNPFADPAAGPGDYEVTVAAGVAPGSNATLASNTVGALIYRAYVPDDPTDPTGGVGLPQITVVRTDGTEAPLPQCPMPGANSDLVNLVNAFGPATDRPATDPPVFARPLDVAGLYANPDNGYVAAIAEHSAGEIVVVRGTAPATPATEAGESPAAAGQQLRYWSLCTNEYRKPYPVSDCAYDAQIPVDASGAYTVVVSTVADRPANSTPADGVLWLDWGSTTQDMVMILRHMLPAADFAENVFSVPPGADASTAMAEYAPVAATCGVADFEAGGAAACGL
jgi:hypothetical protein